MKFEIFPAIIGATYTNTTIERLGEDAQLISADMISNEFTLRIHPFNDGHFWRGNFEKFAYYWRLKDLVTS